MFTNLSKRLYSLFPCLLGSFLVLGMINYIRCGLAGQALIARAIEVSVADLMIMQTEHTWILLPVYLLTLWYALRHDWMSGYMLRWQSRWKLYVSQVCFSIVLTLLFLLVYLLLSLWIGRLFAYDWINFHSDDSQFRMVTGTLQSLSFGAFLGIYSLNLACRLMLVGLILIVCMWAFRHGAIVLVVMSAYDIIADACLQILPWNILVSNQYLSFMHLSVFSYLAVGLLILGLGYIGMRVSQKREMIKDDK